VTRRNFSLSPPSVSPFVTTTPSILMEGNPDPLAAERESLVDMREGLGAGFKEALDSVDIRVGVGGRAGNSSEAALSFSRSLPILKSFPSVPYFFDGVAGFAAGEDGRSAMSIDLVSSRFCERPRVRVPMDDPMEDRGVDLAGDSTSVMVAPSNSA